jgi:hypothetical protein
MSELFRKLKENNGDSRYGFQGGSQHPFRDRPGVSSTSRGTMVKPGRKTSSNDPKHRETVQMRTGDRPVAYEPPEADDEDFIVEWEPPHFSEMLKDLGLRMLEVGIGAAALAIGQEVAYYFGKRRMFTREQRDRRDYR